MQMIGIQKALISRNHSKEDDLPVEDSPSASIVPNAAEEEFSQEKHTLL